MATKQTPKKARVDQHPLVQQLVKAASGKGGPNASPLAAQLVAAPNSDYGKLRVAGRTLGWLSARRQYVRFDHLARPLADAPAAVRKGLEADARGCVRVTEANLPAARRFVAWLATHEVSKTSDRANAGAKPKDTTPARTTPASAKDAS